MSDYLKPMSAADFGGVLPVGPLLEAYRPQDLGHFEHTKELLAGGHLRYALQEYDQMRLRARLGRGLQEALVSDDLPVLLAAGTTTFFQRAYDSIAEEWRACFPVNPNWTRIDTYRFANLTDLQVDDGTGNTSESGTLPEVKEGQGYNQAKLGEEYETGEMKTYGATFWISRKVLINDDRNALAEVPAAMGVAAKRTRNRLVASLLETNGNMVDGHPLFDATNHHNLQASATALSLVNLEAEMANFMAQTTPGGRVMRVRPRYLIVPPELEITAHAILDNLAQGILVSGMGTTFAGRGPSTPVAGLEIVVLEELTDANDWYLAAQSALVPTVEIGALNGADGAQLFVSENMDLSGPDGLMHKVRLDCAVYAKGWRGIRKITGA